MPERKPQQQRGHARRQAVVEGAARVFDRVGYGGASLSDIARESGTTQGSMYFYFPSKEELALAVINEQNARTFAALAEVGAGNGSYLALIAASRVIAQHLVTDAVVRAGIRLSLDQGTLSVPTTQFYRDWIGSVGEQLAAAVAEGELRSDIDSDELGRSVVSYFTGAQLVSNVLTSREDLLSALRTMWNVLTLAIVVPERQADVSAFVEQAFSEDSDATDLLSAASAEVEPA
ncbi:ScbR family autoregulator-binding transcription factor [Plantibacter sp. YIM 135249]|uniref:ScbR family autoregulator-binding transcription factor n=1 Tax=Plantibacter sp. YIM 135249 TaxID=3423918 RepID=UPI003D3254DD